VFFFFLYNLIPLVSFILENVIFNNILEYKFHVYDIIAYYSTLSLHFHHILPEINWFSTCLDVGRESVTFLYTFHIKQNSVLFTVCSFQLTASYQSFQLHYK